MEEKKKKGGESAGLGKGQDSTRNKWGSNDRSREIPLKKKQKEGSVALWGGDVREGPCKQNGVRRVPWGGGWANLGTKGT